MRPFRVPVPLRIRPAPDPGASMTHPRNCRVLRGCGFLGVRSRNRATVGAGETTPGRARESHSPTVTVDEGCPHMTLAPFDGHYLGQHRAMPPFRVSRSGGSGLTYSGTRRVGFRSPTTGVRSPVTETAWIDDVRALALVRHSPTPPPRSCSAYRCPWRISVPITSRCRLGWRAAGGDGLYGMRRRSTGM